MCMHDLPGYRLKKYWRNYILAQFKQKCQGLTKAQDLRVKKQVKHLVNWQAGNYISALTCSLEQLLSRSESTGHIASEIFSMTFELDLSFDWPAGQHSLVRRQRPHLHEVDLCQVIVDGVHLPWISTLSRLIGSGLLFRSKLLLQPEDQGPDVSRVVIVR